MCGVICKCRCRTQLRVEVSRTCLTLRGMVGCTPVVNYRFSHTQRKKLTAHSIQICGYIFNNVKTHFDWNQLKGNTSSIRTEAGVMLSQAQRSKCSVCFDLSRTKLFEKKFSSRVHIIMLVGSPSVLYTIINYTGTNMGEHK